MSSLHAPTVAPRPRLSPALRRALAVALLGAGGASVAALGALGGDDAGVPLPPAAAIAGTRLGVTVHAAEWRELAICETGPCPAPTDATAQPRRELVHRTRTIALTWSYAP